MSQSLAGFILFLYLQPVFGAEVYKFSNLENESAIWALIVAESQGTARPRFPREQKNFRKMILRGLRATSLDLSDFNFSDSDLRGADFTGSDLRRANFSGADLREAVFLSNEDAGALFDEKTKLPFSKDEALRRHWVEKP